MNFYQNKKQIIHTPNKQQLGLWCSLCVALTFIFFLQVPCSFASGPSIEGKIIILDRAGNPKTDHSGVVVFLDEMENPVRVDSTPRKAVMSQINKQFDPRILPILTGTTVDFPNEDVIFHNVFSLSKAKSFDLGIYPQKSSKSGTFDQTGLIKVYCNIHSQMIGYILVLDNPYFTVTDKDGHFKLSDIPTGSVKLRTWYSATHTYPEKKILVTEEGIHDLNLSIIENINLEIREETISIEHHNKWGQDYPEKY